MAGKVAGDGVPCLDEQAMLDVDVGKQAVLDLDETAVWEPRDQTRQEKTVVDQARQDQAKVEQPRAAEKPGTWLLQVVEVVALMAALMAGPAQSLQRRQVAEATPWDLQWRQKIVGRTSWALVCVAKSATKVGEAHSVTRRDQNPGIVAIYLQLTKTPFQNDPATGQITYSQSK